MGSLTSVQTQTNVRVGLGKVLLVEDEALIRETVALSLADEGFEVVVADNGQRALEMQTIGGWGFDLSDQASGAWLGRRLLQEAVLADDGRRSHTALSRAALRAHNGLVGTVHFASGAKPADFAPFAREVLEAAKAGDALGCALVSEGAA